MNKLTLMLLGFTALSLSCGGAASNTGNPNKTNSNNSTSNALSSSNTSTNSETRTSASTSNAEPISKDAFEFFTAVKESSDPKTLIGRSATITELDLKEITSSTLHLGYSWYFYVDCEGSFSDYMSVADVVAKRAKDKPVQGTIKGVIKEASIETVKLDPCVLIDVKK